MIEFTPHFSVPLTLALTFMCCIQIFHLCAFPQTLLSNVFVIAKSVLAIALLGLCILSLTFLGGTMSAATAVRKHVEAGQAACSYKHRKNVPQLAEGMSKQY